MTLNQSTRSELTGRVFALIDPSLTANQSIKKSKSFGFDIASTDDFFKSTPNIDQENNELNNLIFKEFNVALLDGDSEKTTYLQNNISKSPFSLLIPEKYVYALPIMGTATTSQTWGLNITRGNNSQYSGKGVKVAILDTGLDNSHGDFIGRTVIGRNFSTDKNWKDGNGHGTHCTGTACGNMDTNGTKYGIAYDSEIYIGKVLANSGRGTQAAVMTGLLWALQNNCKVASLSLGSIVKKGEKHNPILESVAQSCLNLGMLIVAAAGNDSDRPRTTMPVSSPANCPSVLAVGAVDRNRNIASFSNKGINRPNSNIDMVAPGVDIYSSWLNSTHKFINGTSMAAPHVSGIAALYCEKYPNFTAQEIWNEITSNAIPLNGLHFNDQGNGLVQAP